MRLNKRKFASPIGVSLTPMIDIVFLLIIFFMTLPQLTKIVFHPVELPTVQEIDDDSQSQKITINVTRQGQLFVDSQPLDDEELKSELETMLAELNGDASRLYVLIRADGQSDSGRINNVLQLLTDLGIQRVRVSARSQR